MNLEAIAIIGSQPVGFRQVADYGGVNSETGEYNNPDGQIQGGGHPAPTFTGGIRVSLGWKGLTFSTAGYGMAGNQVLMTPSVMYPYYLRQVWTPEHPDAVLPVPNHLHSSSLWLDSNLLQDASFFRLSDVRFTYRFPKVAVYAALQDIALITSYAGTDPEMALYSLRTPLLPSDFGVETALFPTVSKVVLGISCEF